MNADGTQPTALTTATAVGADSYAPHFTADGNAVVFTSYRMPNGTDAANPAQNIWRINADGTSLTTLTNLNAGSSGAQPSP
jgi:Tol biopolymer transport system component